MNDAHRTEAVAHRLVQELLQLRHRFFSAHPANVQLARIQHWADFDADFRFRLLRPAFYKRQAGLLNLNAYAADAHFCVAAVLGQRYYRAAQVQAAHIGAIAHGKRARRRMERGGRGCVCGGRFCALRADFAANARDVRLGCGFGRRCPGTPRQRRFRALEPSLRLIVLRQRLTPHAAQNVFSIHYEIVYLLVEFAALRLCVGARPLCVHQRGLELAALALQLG